MTAAPDLSTETPVADALVEGALRQVHLTGAILLRGEFAAPWALESMGPEDLAEMPVLPWGDEADAASRCWYRFPRPS